MVRAPDPRFNAQRSERQAPLFISDSAEVGGHIPAPGIKIFELVLRLAPRLTLSLQFGLICFELSFLRCDGFQLFLDERSDVRIVRVS